MTITETFSTENNRIYDITRIGENVDLSIDAAAFGDEPTIKVTALSGMSFTVGFSPVPFDHIPVVYSEPKLGVFGKCAKEHKS